MPNIPSEPLTRKEAIYNAILTGDVSNLPEPLTREEEYLEAIALKISGGMGTNDYDELSHRPKINDVTLTGNVSSSDLNLQETLSFDDEPTEESDNPVKSGGVYASTKNTIKYPNMASAISSQGKSGANSYTATGSCWVYIYAYLVSNIADEITIKLNNVEIASQSCSYQYQKVNAFVPLEEGDTISTAATTADTHIYTWIKVYGTR